MNATYDDGFCYVRNYFSNKPLKLIYFYTDFNT